MQIGLLAAFLGGALALLSPCGALLLPAFFASTAGSGRRLLVHGAVFFVGLALTLVPLGMGASLLGSALTQHRDVVIMVAGVVVVVLGAVQLLGGGFDLGALVPGFRAAQQGAARRTGLPRSFLLGTVSGVAGFCAGPILGAVLTMAATESSPLVSGTMLAVYAAGMVAPMLVLAAAWGRLGADGRARLRGRSVRVGRLHLHTTSVVTGALLIAVGVVFLTTNGMAALPELVPADALARAQTTVMALTPSGAEPVLVALVAVAVLVWWFRRTKRSDSTAAAAEPGAPAVEPAAVPGVGDEGSRGDG